MKRKIKLGSIAAMSVVALPIIAAVSCGTPANINGTNDNGKEDNTIQKINFAVTEKPVTEKTFKITQSIPTLNIGKDYKIDKWYKFQKQTKSAFYKKYLTAAEYDILQQITDSSTTEEIDNAVASKNESKINSSLFKVKKLFLGTLVPLTRQAKEMPIKITYTDETKTPKMHTLVLKNDMRQWEDTFGLLWTLTLDKTEILLKQKDDLSQVLQSSKNGIKLLENLKNTFVSSLNELEGTENDPLIEAYAIDNKITKQESLEKIFGIKEMKKKITDLSEKIRKIKQTFKELEK